MATRAEVDGVDGIDEERLEGLVNIHVLAPLAEVCGVSADEGSDLGGGGGGRNDGLWARIVGESECGWINGGVDSGRDDESKVAVAAATAMRGNSGSVGLERVAKFGEGFVGWRSFDLGDRIWKGCNEVFRRRDGGAHLLEGRQSAVDRDVVGPG